MFHGLDVQNHEHIFKFLPVLAFTEAYVYELDHENENILKEASANKPVPVMDTDPFFGLKKILMSRDLLTQRISQEMQSGVLYWKLEQSLCLSKQISISDVHRIMELTSFDYKLLNLLLYKMRGEEVNELHFNILGLSDLLVDIVDDLSDYEEDVMDNVYNIVRMFVKVYGSKAPKMLRAYISEKKQQLEEQLDKLEPKLRENFPLRYAEELSKGKSTTDIWEVPTIILDEPAYRQGKNGTASIEAKVSIFESTDTADEETRKAARDFADGFRLEHECLTVEEEQSKLMEFAQELKQMPISVYDETAREEMYELPAEFYKLCLGKRLKFGSLYFGDGIDSLDEAEEAMLKVYVERAQLEDGQCILDLGGGYGPVALYIAQKFPKSQITVVSHSSAAKKYIEDKCREQGLSNVTAIDCDVATAAFGVNSYDRILCIEILEYLKNYKLLFKKIESWMKPDGLLFVELVCSTLSPFHAKDMEDGEFASWLFKYFFNGGTCLSDGLLLYFQDDLSIVDHWRLSGMHFSKSSKAFARRLEENKDAIFPIFARTYGQQNAAKWIAYWKRYFLSDAEIFASNKGQDWITSHYLFCKKTASA